jgi:hypothetical protein
MQMPHAPTDVPDIDRTGVVHDHVRADITTLTTVIGWTGAFTDLGRTIGDLVVRSKRPQARRRKGKIDDAPSSERDRFYLVTEALAGHIAAQGGCTARHADLHIWLRPGPGPIADDPVIRTFPMNPSR